MRQRELCVAVVLLLFMLSILLFLFDNDFKGNICKTMRFLPAPPPIQGDRNIFFVETSCAVEGKNKHNAGLVLPPRTACAVESAASAHPGRPVYLVHSCPLDEADPLRGAPPYARALFAQPNVFLWNAPFNSLFKGSPLQGLVDSGRIGKSKWPESHASDVLRYFLLWKYGGTYLDSDILVLKPFGELRDFSCAESQSLVSAGAIDFSWEAPGRLLANKSLNETLKFNPSVWVANGPGVITRAMQDACGVKKVKEMETTKCQGFQLLPTAAIYPVFYSKWRLIFSSDHAAETMKKINGSYAIHMWNSMTKGARVNTTSNQPYAQIARRVCPEVIATVGEFI